MIIFLSCLKFIDNDYILVFFFLMVSQISSQIQIETTTTHHVTLFRMTIFKNNNNKKQTCKFMRTLIAFSISMRTEGLGQEVTGEGGKVF